MMNIYEYFYNEDMTVEELEARMREEVELYESEEDLEGWCVAHGVDFYAENEDGVRYVALWCWDMGED